MKYRKTRALTLAVAPIATFSLGCFHDVNMFYIGQTPGGTRFVVSHVADRIAGTKIRLRDDLIAWPLSREGEPEWAVSLTRDVVLIDRFSQHNKSLELRGAENRAWLVYDGETIASVDFDEMLAFPKGVPQPDWAQPDMGSLLTNELPHQQPSPARAQ